MDKKTLVDIVTNSVREVVPEFAPPLFVAEDDLIRLGANSIDRAEVVNRYAREAGAQRPPYRDGRCGDHRGLVDVLHARR
jgi:polyketide biosynthesis acyl carrier protein